MDADESAATKEPWVFPVECKGCGVKGGSCPCVGGGGSWCLRSQGWQRTSKRTWWCPCCRQGPWEVVDSEHYECTAAKHFLDVHDVWHAELPLARHVQAVLAQGQARL